MAILNVPSTGLWGTIAGILNSNFALSSGTAEIAGNTPDVSISFNDGVTIDKGYGTVDANGNRAVDFTRASSTGNINKSGVS